MGDILGRLIKSSVHEMKVIFLSITLDGDVDSLHKRRWVQRRRILPGRFVVFLFFFWVERRSGGRLAASFILTRQKNIQASATGV